MNRVADRFLKYVKYHTTANGSSSETPSSEGQRVFARMLAEELNAIGLEDVSVDENFYVMATLPTNISRRVPVIGFVAHMDTSPDYSGENVNPQLVKNYNGRQIVLNDHTVLSPEEFPELLKYIGNDLITTDGTTLLGADDKAGVAEIVTAMEYLLNHPEVEHGKIRICFTPDEEIGRGADKFNVSRFGAEFAYTIDGGEIGELEYENFNAAIAIITITGRNVHPGYAKNKMINSMGLAMELASMFPASEVPEHTEGYEGFYHLVSFKGDVEKSELKYLIRDFDTEGFNSRKQMLANWVYQLRLKYKEADIHLQLDDQYHNMRAKIEPVMHLVEVAQAAMLEAGIKPLARPIRGGTDGARLSFMGLPTPNIFAGGHNFHGRYEFVPVQSMEKAVEVIVNISKIFASRE